jgi:hypothetical protein
MSSKEGHGACMIYLFAISNRVEAICAHFSLGIHPFMEDNYFSAQDWKKLPPIYIYIYIYIYIMLYMYVCARKP